MKEKLLKRQLKQAAGIAKQFLGSAGNFYSSLNLEMEPAALEAGNIGSGYNDMALKSLHKSYKSFQ